MGLVVGTYSMQNKQVNYHTGNSISMHFMTVALIVLKQLDIWGFSGENMFFLHGENMHC